VALRELNLTSLGTARVNDSARSPA